MRESLKCRTYKADITIPFSAGVCGKTVQERTLKVNSGKGTKNVGMLKCWKVGTLKCPDPAGICAPKVLWSFDWKVEISRRCVRDAKGAFEG
jgi:hypothetical protein